MVYQNVLLWATQFLEEGNGTTISCGATVDCDIMYVSDIPGTNKRGKRV